MNTERMAELSDIYGVQDFGQTISTVKIDIVCSDPRTEVPAFASRWDLNSQIVMMKGPGGGWPLVRFTGDTNQIFQMLDHYDNGGV